MVRSLADAGGGDLPLPNNNNNNSHNNNSSINLHVRPGSASGGPALSNMAGGLKRKLSRTSAASRAPRWWKIRLFRGMANDVRRRAPFYWSDWRDAWDYRVVPATIYMYFAKYALSFFFLFFLLLAARRYHLVLSSTILCDTPHPTLRACVRACCVRALVATVHILYKVDPTSSLLSSMNPSYRPPRSPIG